MPGTQVLLSHSRLARVAARVSGALPGLLTVALVTVLVTLLGLPGGATEAWAADGRAPGKPKEERFDLKAPGTTHLALDRVRKESPEPYQERLEVKVRTRGRSGALQHEGGRMTADISQLADRVRFKGSYRCEKPTKTRIDCGAEVLDKLVRAQFDLLARKSARAGDSGPVRFTYTSPEGTVRTATTTVVIGQPRLGVQKLPVRKDVARGDVVRLPMVFKNTGELPVHGVGVWITGGVNIPPEKRHRNCRYHYDSSGVWCFLPDVHVNPGEVWRLSPGPGVRNLGSSLYEKFDYGVFPMNHRFGGSPGDRTYEGGERGRGGPVRAVRTSEKKGDVFHTGPDGPDMYQLTRGKAVHADYQVRGTMVTAPPGETVRVRVGARNNGPGVFDPEDPEVSVALTVTFPPGTKLVRGPRELIDSEERYSPLCERHDRSYTCEVGALRKGKAYTTFDFLVRPGKDGVGKVRLRKDEGELPRNDPKPDNDTAKIVIRTGPDHIATTPFVVLGCVAVGIALLCTRRHWWAFLRRTVRGRAPTS
ncbi:hypothetical protein [Streptomyces sp. NPDC005438]|uniref:hypothetical protein n=1 Tax=Streptomyces sp. NPDC005438 TaxID=3156880 RepID=UPI0033B97BD1